MKAILVLITLLALNANASLSEQYNDRMKNSNGAVLQDVAVAKLDRRNAARKALKLFTVKVETTRLDFANDDIRFIELQNGDVCREELVDNMVAADLIYYMCLNPQGDITLNKKVVLK